MSKLGDFLKGLVTEEIPEPKGTPSKASLGPEAQTPVLQKAPSTSATFDADPGFLKELMDDINASSPISYKTFLAKFIALEPAGLTGPDRIKAAFFSSSISKEALLRAASDRLKLVEKEKMEFQQEYVDVFHRKMQEKLNNVATLESTLATERQELQRLIEESNQRISNFEQQKTSLLAEISDANRKYDIAVNQAEAAFKIVIREIEREINELERILPA